jgi:hypothetical protein
MELVGQVVGQGWKAVATAGGTPAPLRVRAVGHPVQPSLPDEPNDPLCGVLVGQGGVSIEDAPRLSDRPTWVRQDAPSSSESVSADEARDAKKPARAESP